MANGEMAISVASNLRTQLTPGVAGAGNRGLEKYDHRGDSNWSENESPADIFRMAARL